jgi:hypothetical protein
MYRPIIGLAFFCVMFMPGCGDSGVEICEGKLAFDKMMPVQREDAFDLAIGATYSLIYSGTYSAKCKRMFYRGIGSYTFEIDVRAHPSPAHIRQILLADGRSIVWDKGKEPSLEFGTITYIHPVLSETRRDRNLLLPWNPVPQRLFLDIDYPVKPDLEFFPLSIGYNFRWGEP